MSNAWALRGIHKKILRKERQQQKKIQIKDRHWQLILRNRNQRITMLQNRVERLESEIESYRRLSRGLGHQMGNNRLNKEIFDLLVSGDFTGSTSCAHESPLTEQVIGELRAAFLNIPKLSWYPPAGVPFERDGQKGTLVLTEKGKDIFTRARSAAHEAIRNRYPITHDLILKLELDDEQLSLIRSVVADDRDVACTLYSREMLDLLATGQISHSTEGGASEAIQQSNEVIPVKVNYWGCDYSDHEEIQLGDGDYYHDYRCSHPNGGYCNLDNKFGGDKAECPLLAKGETP